MTSTSLPAQGPAPCRATLLLTRPPTSLWLCTAGFIALVLACSVAVAAGDDAAADDRFGAAWQTADCKPVDVPDTISAVSDCGYVAVPEQPTHGRGKSQPWTS